MATESEKKHVPDDFTGTQVRSVSAEKTLVCVGVSDVATTAFRSAKENKWKVKRVGISCVVGHLVQDLQRVAGTGTQ